jgi:hypothetical protein
MPSEDTRKMKIILFMPSDLQQVYSAFLQTILGYPEPIICSTLPSLEKSYISNGPAIIITIYYRLLNNCVHERLKRFATVYYGNIIVVRHDLNVYERFWAVRLLKAIRFFADPHRPLASIVTVGIGVAVYMNSSLFVQDDHGLLTADEINTAELIKFDCIYKFKLFDESPKHARIHKGKKKNHLRLVPDIIIGNSSLIPIDNIPLTDIAIIGRVTHEYWQY